MNSNKEKTNNNIEENKNEKIDNNEEWEDLGKKESMKENLFLHFEVENYFDELEIDENYLKKILK